MPSAPKTARPSFRCVWTADAEYDARRAGVEWRKWYGLARWKRRRAAQLSAQPLCCMCLADGRMIAASVADHIEPHRGDYAKFWEGALQSLCAFHHNRDKQSAERAGR